MNAGREEIMKLKQYPTKIEIYDEPDEIIATVETFDESSALVTITAPVNVEMWDEISAEIRDALVKMELK